VRTLNGICNWNCNLLDLMEVSNHLETEGTLPSEKLKSPKVTDCTDQRKQLIKYRLLRSSDTTHEIFLFTTTILSCICFGWFILSVRSFDLISTFLFIFKYFMDLCLRTELSTLKNCLMKENAGTLSVLVLF